MISQQLFQAWLDGAKLQYRHKDGKCNGTWFTMNKQKVGIFKRDDIEFRVQPSRIRLDDDYQSRLVEHDPCLATKWCPCLVTVLAGLWLSIAVAFAIMKYFGDYIQ